MSAIKEKKIKRFSFIIAAAGLGERMGGSPKQFRNLGEKPLWQWSLSVTEELLEEKKINEVIVVVPGFAVERVKKEVAKITRFPLCYVVIAGGTTRTESVKKALKSAHEEFVLIHDAARPFLSVKLCERIMDTVSSEHGVIPVLPVTDALKKIERLEKNIMVSSVSRDKMYRTQTPQAFPRATLLEMLKDNVSYKDEAEVWVKSKCLLETVEGDSLNMKMTYPDDFKIAEILVERKKEYRTGHGFDIHPLVPSRILILGGVPIDSPLGLDGYSDGDVLTHTVMDALLGAAGLPDIGRIFPANDPIYKDAYSFELLQEVLALLQKENWKIEWIDVTLQAQVPHLAPYIDVIIQKLESAFAQIQEQKNIIHIKIKSGEHIGPVGRAECMMCSAVATLSRNGRLH
ncbi:2-C-methyl-D-erythritol 2,4-cyclodiphosphate synthase [Aminobacterium sp. MB27-C1]|jgi:2-C-methyl-D-erythritol 4-phosphate cytidylyltransferase/2-C-methyl-D-erythritol 2,4-cyclodiphosphate synthase|uniref:2-C-methyl-D-erythritol 2,4-cyclodiphosphate synthase n=1 Tax=unclassified Aminobacterium TaxID=2685012 RepID=UPI001BCEAF43|nr:MULTISPECIES: 2-C-methyl-D-erythritol 2,4-cyclodiphosphate synthase [unclassified Aminobacterium]MDD3706653.1 2-C-methyl-D-erythritol 2,4-cyclodiphosphate synthase [Aminobacterium sp.]MEA4876947.1 2-C-methyl-D-erythritol 2,4-cyclodiphosphate synthase [Aminobacterium sp.]WMI72508.1 2-C-methyl-D-erythritol 2,4-cyclodiphosphate synthase [Aminobacterium sp. MB27-C1]